MAKTTKKILFYNDVAGFGGHELMSFEIINAIIATYPDLEIHYLYAEDNEQLHKQALTIEKLKRHPLSLHVHRFSFLTNLIASRNAQTVSAKVRQITPDCIVAVQGTIDISSLGLLVAWREKIPVVTYIALAQKLRVLGVGQATFRDFVYRLLYYHLPDRFIAISNAQKDYLLVNKVPEDKVAVVQNIVRRDTICRHDRATARRQMGLGSEITVVGLIGRVVSAHKGHDLLVQAVARHQHLLKDIVFVVVGDGPDLAHIKQQVSRHALHARIIFMPWTEQVGWIYSALDGIVMPSNHEGVPLVMIEAGLYGIPVIASAIDGMKEYLPSGWLFARGDIDGMAYRILEVMSHEQCRQIDWVKESFERIFQRRTLGQEIVAALTLTHVKATT